MLDIIFLYTDYIDDKFQIFQEKFPFIKYVLGYDVVDRHYSAASNANTSFFYVVDPNYFPLDDFNFDYQPNEIDKQWVMRFKNAEGDFTHGIRLFHKSQFNQTVTDKKTIDFIHNFGEIGIKDVDVIASSKISTLKDVILISTRLNDLTNLFNLEILQQKVPSIQYIECNDVVDLHYAAANKAKTSFFFVVDNGFEITDFDFNYEVDPADKQWVTRFKNTDGEFTKGLRLFHKSQFNQKVTDKKTIDFIHNFGDIGIKDVDTVATKASKIIPDVIFITSAINSWKNADEFKRLKLIVPNAKYVECADIVDLHFNAADMSATSFFYVVDNSFKITNGFDFSREIFEADAEWVTRFKNSDDEFNDGVRLFHKSAFKQCITDKSKIDFIHNFGEIGIKDVDVIASEKLDLEMDIVLAVSDLRNWSNTDLYDRIKNKFPNAKFVENSDVVDMHYEAAKVASTSFFYVIDAGFEFTPEFGFSYVPNLVDKQWVIRFKNANGEFTKGLRLFHKSAFDRKVKDKKNVDFINNFGEIGIKDIDDIACSKVSLTPDIIFLTHNRAGWKDYVAKLNKKVKIVEGDNIIKMHKEAAKKSETSFFYVIDAGFLPTADFDFSYQPDPEDANWVLRFKGDKSYTEGVRLMHKKVCSQKIKTGVDFINNFGVYGVKDLPQIAVSRQNIPLDIVFIDTGESFADLHYELIKKKYGERVKRVSNIEGLWNAHAAAAVISSTHMFYVVDADTIIKDSFIFNYAPSIWDENYVYIWNSYCELTKLTYGNAGVKMLNKNFFLEKPKKYIDMTTTIGHDIAKGIKIMPEIASINKFYEDKELGWRGAFRECAKLKSGLIHGSVQKENQERLDAWLNFKSDHPNAEVVKAGAVAGVKFIEDGGDIHKINNYKWLKEQYNG